jgi:hypothetical protein
MKTVKCTLVSVLISVLLNALQLLAQISPPVPPRIGDPIDFYRFNDTNWTSAHGFAPCSFSGIEGVTGWGTNLAMRIAGSGPAWLQYNYIDVSTNGSQTNLTFPEGALTFWVRPLWSGTNIDGGTGPGVPGRLIELGAFTEQGNGGWFSLFLDEDGTTLSLGVQSNQYTAVPIQAPISWESNTWHFLVLNYTSTNLQLYLDGQLAASATNGLPFWPGDTVLTNGLFIGSDSSGANLANADFAYIRAYDWAILEPMIASQYNRVLTNYLQENLGMHLFVGFGIQFWENAMESGTNGLSLSIALEDNKAILTVSGGQSGILYDLYYATNLLGSNATESAWTWLSSVSSGQRYYWPNQPSPVYYMLGTPLDSDSDGLPNAFEMLVSHSQTNNADSDADGLPDGWEWRNFGSFSQTASGDYDQDGISNLQEYQQHTDPNTISFSPRLGNRYFHVTNAVGTCEIFKGAAAYWAVQVGPYSTNCNTWQPYAGQVTLPLGPTNGAYNVWVGLKGSAADSVPAWVGTTVYLDTVAPVLTLSCPTSGVVTKRIIQATGYSPEELGAISYDLDNAAGEATNQPVLIIGQSYSTNTAEFTSNFFQAYDVPLINGLNALTFRATDLAGNVTTLTTNFTLDYSTKTNPPVVQLFWPQNGMEICGSNIVCRGQVSDDTATVKVCLTDVAGATNTADSLVGRDGIFYANNLTLSPGPNYLTYTVTDSAGNVTQTNITISTSTLALTIDPVVAGQTQVTGTVGDTQYTLCINGIRATVNQNGTWSATIPPIGIGGGAVVVNAVLGGGDPSLQQIVDPPQGVFISSYHASLQAHSTVLAADCFYDMLDWEDGSGGKAAEFAYYYGPRHPMLSESQWPTTAWPQSLPEGDLSSYDYMLTTNFDLGSGTILTNDVEATDPPTLKQEHCNRGEFLYQGAVWQERTADTAMKLATGGTTGSRQMNLWCLSATATAYTNLGDMVGTLVPPDQIEIGAFGKQDTNAELWVLLPDNDPDDVTPKVNDKNNYTFTVNAKKYTLKHTTYYPALTDTNRSRTTIGVGEEVTFGFTPTMAYAMDWTTTAGSVSPTLDSSTKLTAPSNAASGLIVTAKLRGGKSVQFPPFSVVEPSSIDHAKIIGTNTYPTGSAGAGMTNAVWFAPTSVSFYRVNMMEVGLDATNISGFFTNNTANQLHHNPNSWITLDQTNHFNDWASFGSYSSWGSGGAFSWNIPYKWQVIGSGVTNSMVGYSQVFSIDANGTARINKYGNWIQRTTNNVITTN